jgi:sulfofructose kinase
VLADLRWMEGARVAFAAARNAGVPTVLDADLGGREALAELLESTDFAIFSAPALEEFAAGDAIEDRLRRVAALGPRHAGVTLGEAGYLWLEGGTTSRSPAFEIDVVDTTGAGDAFHGAFTLGLAEGRLTPEIVRRACAVAAMKCTRLGSRAGLPTAGELAAFLMTRPVRQHGPG